MRNIRIIARLDVKAPNLVKGIQFEGLRILGNPNEFAKKYYAEGIDELYYEDIVASLYERNTITDIIEKTTNDVFVPITVGGGIRTMNDVSIALRAGADKASINTAAIKNPNIISDCARRFGSSCIVLSIQAKKIESNWNAYYDNGRENSFIDVIDWAKKGQEMGAGEIILTSVDNEGTRKGFDINLIKSVTSAVDIPVIASGGMGEIQDLIDVVKYGNADAVAIGNVLHYKKFTISEIRKFCCENKISVRILD